MRFWHRDRAAARRSDGLAEDRPVLSAEAHKLHTFAVLSSIEADHPGWVHDSCLAGLDLDTSTSAVELELCGLWTRGAGGYHVAPREVKRVARVIDEQLRELRNLRDEPS